MAYYARWQGMCRTGYTKSNIWQAVGPIELAVHGVSIRNIMFTNVAAMPLSVQSL